MEVNCVCVNLPLCIESCCISVWSFACVCCVCIIEVCIFSNCYITTFTIFPAIKCKTCAVKLDCVISKHYVSIIKCCWCSLVCCRTFAITSIINNIDCACLPTHIECKGWVCVHISHICKESLNVSTCCHLLSFSRSTCEPTKVGISASCNCWNTNDLVSSDIKTFKCQTVVNIHCSSTTSK